MKSIEITKCLFCDGYIPASYDQVYINHMNDHHRAFVNIEFLFQISLLGVNDLDSLNVDYDLKLNAKSNLVLTEPILIQPSTSDSINEELEINSNSANIKRLVDVKSDSIRQSF